MIKASDRRGAVGKSPCSTLTAILQLIARSRPTASKGGAEFQRFFFLFSEIVFFSFRSEKLCVFIAGSVRDGFSSNQGEWGICILQNNEGGRAVFVLYGEKHDDKFYFFFFFVEELSDRMNYEVQRRP